MTDITVKSYDYEKSDKENDNKNNEQVKTILIQIRAALSSLEKRVSALEREE